MKLSFIKLYSVRFYNTVIDSRPSVIDCNDYYCISTIIKLVYYCNNDFIKTGI